MSPFLKSIFKIDLFCIDNTSHTAIIVCFYKTSHFLYQSTEIPNLLPLFISSNASMIYYIQLFLIKIFHINASYASISRMTDEDFCQGGNSFWHDRKFTAICLYYEENLCLTSYLISNQSDESRVWVFFFYFDTSGVMNSSPQGHDRVVITCYLK